jgi:F-type H+-transporting ATPase subunit epsilon
MHVTIAKVDENLFDGEAVSLTVPGSDGEMTVLSHHEPFITTLKSGTITVRPDRESGQTFSIDSGILEVNPEGATVIL